MSADVSGTRLNQPEHSQKQAKRIKLRQYILTVKEKMHLVNYFMYDCTH